MSGLIGKKIGMTSLFDTDGSLVGCTVIEAGPCVVSHVKTTEKDGYQAVQLSYGERGEKNSTKASKGHYAKANTTPKVKAHEFEEFEQDLKLGDTVDCTLFEEGSFVTVTGNIVRTGGAGTENVTLTLDGSTLNMSGNSIGSGGANINFAAASGTLTNLAQLNGGGLLDKTTAGISCNAVAPGSFCSKDLLTRFAAYSAAVR